MKIVKMFHGTMFQLNKDEIGYLVPFGAILKGVESSDDMMVHLELISALSKGEVEFEICSFKENEEGLYKSNLKFSHKDKEYHFSWLTEKGRGEPTSMAREEILKVEDVPLCNEPDVSMTYFWKENKVVICKNNWLYFLTEDKITKLEVDVIKITSKFFSTVKFYTQFPPLSNEVLKNIEAMTSVYLSANNLTVTVTDGKKTVVHCSYTFNEEGIESVEYNCPSPEFIGPGQYIQSSLFSAVRNVVTNYSLETIVEGEIDLGKKIKNQHQ